MPSKITIAAVVIAVAAAIAVIRAQREGPVPAAVGPVNDQSAREIAALKAELNSLKGNVAGQRVLLANVLEKSGAPRAPASAEAAGEQASAVSPPRPELTPKQIFAKLDEKFFAEPAQGPQARTATQKLSTTLTRLVPAGSSLGKIDCRESLCRIEATHQDRGAYGAFIKATFLGRQTGLWSAGFTSELLEETPTESKSVTFFGATEGGEIPPLDDLGLASD